MSAPPIGIIMGSRSDWPTMEYAAHALDALGIPYEAEVVSAHRTPEKLFTYAKTAGDRGLKLIIAGAGGAAHLPGMIAALTPLPVLGVPVESKALHGLDSLLSIVQMPGGIPTATFAIGPSGARNAGLFAAAILALTDPGSVHWFADQVDLVTVESENIDAAVLEGLNLSPNARAIGIAQDRLLEKRFLHDCGIQTAPSAPIDSLEDLQTAIAQLGLPAILKTRRMGYDGKGQVRLADPDEAAAAWIEIAEAPAILEGHVPFTKEVSLIAARNASGDIVFYPLTENHHRAGILRTSIAPCDCAALQPTAEAYLRKLLTGLDYIGILAVEFFSLGGHLIANEMAPRVHNSGHWTIEGAQTSQFENHLRALLNLPLGPTMSQPTVMLNCIGTMPPPEETARFPHLHRHDYGKEPRPGRKIGHLTFPANAKSAIDYWQQRLAND